jgi:3-methyladenine DNA glycosylase Mpg
MKVPEGYVQPISPEPAQALGITRRHYGAEVTAGPPTVRASNRGPAPEMETTPRIGIRQRQDRPLRLVIKGQFCSSRPSPSTLV